MADNFEKLPLQHTLNATAINQATQAIQRTGRALPCKVVEVDGSIVTVSFEVQGGPWTLPQITIPKAESAYFRAPTQKGDFGITLPADTFLGAVSGLGDGVADLTVDNGNLSNLAFMPIGSTQFPTAPDPDKAFVNGPNGFFICDTGQLITIVGDKNDGTLTIAVGDQQLVITQGGDLTATMSGTVTVNAASAIVNATANAEINAVTAAVTATGPCTITGNPIVLDGPTTLGGESGADYLVKLGALQESYNSHTHTGIEPGGSSSGTVPPDQQLPDSAGTDNTQAS